MPAGEEVGEGEGKGNGAGCFYLSLAGGNLRGGLRGGFQWNIHQFSRSSLSGSWSPPTGQFLGHCSGSWHGPPASAAFLGLELKDN